LYVDELIARMEQEEILMLLACHHAQYVGLIHDIAAGRVTEAVRGLVRRGLLAWKEGEPWWAWKLTALGEELAPAAAEAYDALRALDPSKRGQVRWIKPDGVHKRL
jgi:hypothetical protein